MEDVNISIYRASVVREGSTPASPGFVVSDGQNPVDPSGSGQNHLPVTIATAATGLSITESQVLGGAGNVGQYIRGDGSLADFPESSGGGSSISYYLNGSVSQGTIGGVAYKELNKVPILGAGTDFTINADGYIASFLTDAGDPNLLEIPGGNWNFETYFSASSSGGTPTFYVELYKVNSGGTATLIASNSTFPELIAFGTNIISYFSTLAVPTTALALTDRLAIRYYVTHSGRTITLHTEDNHLCQIVTTFTTGITALNGLTAQVQNFAVGTSGTDFAISSATATHTFNLPTASATNRGALSSADWTTFNNKTSNLGTVTSVGLSSATSGVTIGSSPVTTSGTITLAIATASGSQNGLLSSTDWTTFNSKQNALTNPVTGTGTTNYLPKFTGASTIGNSNLFNDSNGNLGIGTINPNFTTTNRTTVDINGTSSSLLALSVGGASKSYLFQSGNDLFINNTTGLIAFNAETSNIISFATSNQEAMRIFSSRNVHIGPTPATDNGARLQVSGTATVSGALTINGDLNFNSAGGTTYLNINQGTGADGGIILKRANVNRWQIAQTISGDNLNFYSYGTSNDVLRLNYSTGRATFRGTGDDIVEIGVGTASQNAYLQLNAGSAANAYINSIGSGSLILGANGGASNHLLITSGGNVGINVTPTSGNRFWVKGSSTSSGDSTILAQNSAGTNLFYVLNNGNVVMPNGNVLIGTTTDGTQKLRVAGITRVTKLVTGEAGLAADNYTEFSNDDNVGYINTNRVVNNGDFHFRFDGTSRANINRTTGVYTATSDLRLKSKIENSQSAMPLINQIKVRQYQWNESLLFENFGFIAQELEEILPNYIHKPINDNDFWKISKSELVPLLVKAIQELNQEIDTLKN